MDGQNAVSQAMTVEEKMFSGLLYYCAGDGFDAPLRAKFERAKDLLWEFNRTRASELAKRDELLQYIRVRREELLYRAAAARRLGLFHLARE